MKVRHECGPIAFVAGRRRSLAACGAKPPPRKSCGRCSSRRSRIGGTADASVFAGEVKPRHEADLGFRIGGKIIARYVDVGARVQEGPGARAPRSRRRRLAGRRRQGAGRGDRDRVQVRAGGVRALPESPSARSSSARRRSTRSATRSTPIARSSSRRRRTSRSRRTRRATRRSSRTRTASSRRSTPSRDRWSPRASPVVRIAREDEREVAISVPENRIGELKSAQAARRRCCGRIRASSTAARVREVSPAVDPTTRTFAVRVSIVDADPSVQWGMTANVGVLARGRIERRAAAADVDLPQGGQARGVALRSRDAAGRDLARSTIGQYREDGVLVTSGVAQRRLDRRRPACTS